MRFTRSCRLAVALLAIPSLALTHTGTGHVAGFMQGLAHPVSGLDHVLAMVAVGLLAGRLGGAALWRVPASFIVVLACGALLGMAAVPLPFVETGIALSILVFGLLFAAGHNSPPTLTTVLVGCFALFHGHAHGTEAAGNISGLAYIAGLLSASALLHACGVITAVMLMRRLSNDRGRAGFWNVEFRGGVVRRQTTALREPGIHRRHPADGAASESRLHRDYRGGCD
jgi:urease accessory protein